jgi:hypothetical protein
LNSTPLLPEAVDLSVTPRVLGFTLSGWWKSKSTSADDAAGELDQAEVEIDSASTMRFGQVRTPACCNL